jgi:hypothetical protein
MFEPILLAIGNFLVWTWPVLLFLVLAPIVSNAWLFWRQERYKESTEFKLLELRIPREVKKSPRAMEQVLMAIYALKNIAGNFEEKWWDGEIPRWFSLEVTSFGGEIHFYIRLYSKYEPLVKAAFYSYYPDVEVVDADDYTNRFPMTIADMYQQGYDVWGGELYLARESAYPIKSFLDFESPDEEKQYDPISALIEVLAQVKTEEMVAVQILISPHEDWDKEWKGLVAKLKESQITNGEGQGGHGVGKSASRTWDFSSGPLPVLGAKVHDAKEDMGSFTKVFMRTPGETDVLKMVEKNLSKPAFETQIRFLYFSPKHLFYDSFARRGLAGSFNQYGSQDLNMFKIDYSVSTKTNIWNPPYVFPRKRNEWKKKRLLWNYRHREINPHTWIGRWFTSYFWDWNTKSKQFDLNIESLATIYHPPTTMVVTAPHIRRVDSRKTGPPAGLAIFGEEKEIEHFQ